MFFLVFDMLEVVSDNDFNDADNVALYSHAAGNFDSDASCTINRNAPSEKQCCGTYPGRFPYRTSSAGDGVVDRGCCVDKTYASNNMECCDDGSVMLSCDLL